MLTTFLIYEDLEKQKDVYTSSLQRYNCYEFVAFQNDKAVTDVVSLVDYLALSNGNETFNRIR